MENKEVIMNTSIAKALESLKKVVVDPDKLEEILPIMAKEHNYNVVHHVAPEEQELVRFFSRVFPGNLTKRNKEVKVLKSKIGFNVSDMKVGTWIVDTTTDKVLVYPGSIPDVACSISGTGKDIVDVLTGKESPYMAFMSGKLKITGDIGSAMKIATLCE
jgi:putative sterol carrier protein